VHTDRRSGKMFAELENCTTLELSAWPVDHLLARELRCVTPAGKSEPGNAAAPCGMGPFLPAGPPAASSE
jgi:hypothetical protein